MVFLGCSFFAGRLSWLFNTVFIGMNPYVVVYSTFSTLIIIGFDSFPNRERKKSSVVLWLRRGQSSHGVQCMSHTFPTSVTAIHDHGNAILDETGEFSFTICKNVLMMSTTFNTPSFF